MFTLSRAGLIYTMTPMKEVVCRYLSEMTLSFQACSISLIDKLSHTLGWPLDTSRGFQQFWHPSYSVLPTPMTSLQTKEPRLH